MSKDKFDFLARMNADLLEKLKDSNLKFFQEVGKIKSSKEKDFLLKLHKEFMQNKGTEEDVSKKHNEALNKIKSFLNANKA